MPQEYKQQLNRRRNKSLLYNLLLVWIAICLQVFSLPATAQTNESGTGTKPPSHAAWDALLKKWVDQRGMVDYKGFGQDRKQLQAYLRTLEAHPPQEKAWSKEEQLAYWINAYNAYTIELILQHYPVESIEDIKVGSMFAYVKSPWHIKFIPIGGRKLDLNTIEHTIIRPTFKEPRIHFALVCAAQSCPKLRQEAYVPERLEAQLSEQARTFLNDPNKNTIRSDKLELSKIFEWFQEDFTEGRTLQEAISEYSGVPVQANAPVSYRFYSWKLNEQDK